ncbi:GlsB/YeaQ/YmgE family stress response membrane protein [Deltaproteobacteria bacterium PRO3]|nr:GlsB/YeaQ/YmgE family stress response membrane protein [Deltaproteobacteria bacterium PRO3]
MGILSWIVFGLIAGAIAKFLMPGDDPGGCIMTILLGVAGAVIGGFIASTLGIGGGVTNFDLRSFLVAVGGAMVLLLGYRLLRGRR